MNDDEFTSAFNAPQAEDGFSKAFITATSKQMPQAMPSPWEAYGVPKYPAQESTLMRMGRGANVALTKAGTGLKGLFADLSEEDIAKLRAGEAYMQEAGLPATVQYLEGLSLRLALGNLLKLAVNLLLVKR